MSLMLAYIKILGGRNNIYTEKYSPLLNNCKITAVVEYNFRKVRDKKYKYLYLQLRIINLL